VRKNIAFPLRMAKMDTGEQNRRVERAASVLNLTDYLDRRPGQLSGGQRQRVAIDRAIVREPKAFLFDEPLSNLDAALRVDMRLEISELHKRLRTTMVYVAHDQVEAMTMADKIVVLHAGVIEQVGSPLDLHRQPRNTFVAGFIGSPRMNLIGGEEAAKHRATTIGIRPEHCRLTGADAATVTGEVLEIERLGSQTFAFVGVDGAEGPVAVLAESATQLSPGDRAGVQIDPAQVHLFDAAGETIAPAR
jgi:multiple sugar transport system ATP-binding protein